MERICLLVSVLTSSRINPVSTLYWKAGESREFARRYGVAAESCAKEFQSWLSEPGEIVGLLPSMAPTWIERTRSTRVLEMIKQFVGLANSSPYSEEDFLSICQCFEGLRRTRVGSPASKNEVSSEQRSHLLDYARKIGIGRDKRREIEKLLSEPKRVKLRSLLRQAIDEIMEPIALIVGRRPDLAQEIVNRRNDLSHGVSDGTDGNPQWWDKLGEECAVMRVLVLSEILRLGNLSGAQIAHAAIRDPWLRSVGR